MSLPVLLPNFTSNSPQISTPMPCRTSPYLTTGPRLTRIALALCLATVLAACSDKPPAAPAMGPLPVTVLEMQPQRLPSHIEVMAQTEGSRQTEVRARVGGVVTRRLYQEGEVVKAGQALFQIDRAPFEIALAEAQARAEQTAREVARLKALVDAKAISQKDYDDATSNNAMAQAALRQAQLNLSWTTVTAPIAGTSGRAERSEGNLLTAGSDNLLTTINQTDPMWVRFSLGEAELAQLPGGRVSGQTISQVSLIQANGENYARPGKLNFIASQIDTTLGTQQLRAEFANPQQQLLPGQFVRIRLQTGERDGVFLVPQSAVIQSEQGALVMLAGADNKVTPRPVKTGEWQGKDWVILGGLQAGDKVIVDNLIKLRPGAPIAPHAPGPMPGAPSGKTEGAATNGKS